MARPKAWDSVFDKWIAATTAERLAKNKPSIDAALKSAYALPNASKREKLARQLAIRAVGQQSRTTAAGGLTNAAYRGIKSVGPVGVGTAGALALPFLLKMGVGYAENIKRKFTGTGFGGPSYDELLALKSQLQAHARQNQMFSERMQRLSAENTALLARYSPHMFSEVMAGRRLPQGAVVLGGTPRTDLMSDLASSMSQGQFKPPQSAEHDFLTGQQPQSNHLGMLGLVDDAVMMGASMV